MSGITPRAPEVIYEESGKLGGWLEIYGWLALRFWHEGLRQKGIQWARLGLNLAAFARADGTWLLELIEALRGAPDLPPLGGEMPEAEWRELMEKMLEAKEIERQVLLAVLEAARGAR